MATARRIWTNMSKGELTPLVDGRPDLAAYSEGARTLENWLLMRQGGVTRRSGTRFVREIKRSDKENTVLLPFEFSVDDAFIVEMGEGYDRFYKNRANILAFAGGPPVEVVNPYLAAELRSVHFTQSADVMWKFHVNHQQRRLSRISDTSWALSPIIYRPPPSFEVDTDIAGGATLTPAVVTGNSVVFTASAAVFLEGDVGRIIVYGASRAVITGFGASAGDTTTPNDQVRADILDDFPDLTLPPGPDILTGWKLRLSPQTTLDPDKKEPVGAQVTLVAGANAFRAADVGKFIVIYGGLIKITIFDSATQVRGELLSVMSTTLANPAASPAGSWTLEEASWSGIHGFPRTGEFAQGRLVEAATLAQPTTWWMSASDDFDNFAIGTKADNSLEYTIRSKKVNRIQAIADHADLFLFTAGAEFKATSGKTDEPFGGDIVPLVRPTSFEGSAAIQPIILNKRLLFVDRSMKKVFAVAFNIEEDSYDATEVTAAAEHITGDGIRLGPVAYTVRPDPRIYYAREDGQGIALTFFVKEKVIGFTRLVTNGEFESFAVIPQPGGAPDQVWCIVKRTINGQVKRYVEFFEEEITDAVAGPGVFLETTGGGKAWFKGATESFPTFVIVNTMVSVFISDTTVFKFYLRASYLHYRVSLDGGATFSATVVDVTSGADTINDILAVETTEDPADLLPEHKIFIILANDTTNTVWTSRNVIQSNPLLSTWTKASLAGGAPSSLGVRGRQVCVVGQDSGNKIRMHNSNDFGVTFPTVFTNVVDTITYSPGHQFVASPGTDIWVVVNANSGTVYRTTNNGVSWTVVATLTGPGTAARACIINVDDLIMIIIFSGKVWRSTDAGATWSDAGTLADVVTLGYFGDGILAGLVDSTFTGASPGSVEVRSDDYGQTWSFVVVDAGLDLGSNRFISKMAVRGARAIVNGTKFDGGGTTSHWYNPSTQVQIGPGESVDFADRPWTNLQTDSALIYVSATPTRVVPGLSHLEGEEVEVVADGSFRGVRTVHMGSIEMDEEYSKFEVGLHYTSTGVTMRPTVEGSMIEGLQRSWKHLYLRLKDTIGGKINGTPIPYPGKPLDTNIPFSGDRKITSVGWDTEGRVIFTQDQPYPMTVLAVFGTLDVTGE